MSADQDIREVKVDREFAKRVQQAMDALPQAPDFNKGRLRWLQAQLADKFDIKVSQQGIHKWVLGESAPRSAKMKAFAAILKVDAGWLAHGTHQKSTETVRTARAVEITGAKNVVAGLIQMSGGMCAFPSPTSDDGYVDIFAIVSGVPYRLIVAEAASSGSADTMTFEVPTIAYAKCIAVGVVRRSLSELDLYVLPRDVTLADEGKLSPKASLMATMRNRIWAIDGEPLMKIENFADSFEAAASHGT